MSATPIRLSASLALALLPGVFAGCGSKVDPKLPPTTRVTGLVSLKGGPLEVGTITFHPLDDKGNPADGRLLAGGTFELSTYHQGDGAVLGKHKVTIQIPPRLDGEPMRTAVVVPPEYATVDRTPLSAEVTRDGKNHFEFLVENAKPR